MFSVFQKLFGSKPKEEMPIIIEDSAPKKDIEGAKRKVYDQIWGVLEEEGVYLSRSGYDLYPRIKKSLRKINEVIDNSKESLVANESELARLKEKILDHKEERKLSMLTYDVSELIGRSKYEDPSVLSHKAIIQILRWYDLS